MATNVMISGAYSNYAIGTMDANATLSQEIDLGGAQAIGLLAQNLSSGTLEFLSSPYSDFDTRNTSVYANVRKLDATKQASGSVSGTVLFGGDALAFLAPFRYVKILAQNAQSSGPTFTFITKG